MNLLGQPDLSPIQNNLGGAVNVTTCPDLTYSGPHSHRVGVH
jgi:hypothetical protein